MTHPSERTGWREALKVIASAWAVAFLVSFWFIAVATVGDGPSNLTHVRVINFFVTFTGAVTGAGWLIYRSREKRKP